MEQREFYDVQAQADATAVDAVAAVPDPRDRALVRWLDERLRGRAREASRPLEVLELGCGDGSLSRALGALEHVHVLGVDIAAARIARARAASSGARNLSFRVLDLDRELASLGDGSADVVVSVDVLEHVFDVFGFVAHIARLVRPGGLVLLRVPNIAYIRHRWSLAVGELPVTSSWFGPKGDLEAWRTKWGWDGGHLHFFTLPMLRALLETYGLRPLGWRDPGARLSRVRRLAPGLLAGNLAVLAERR